MKFGLMLPTFRAWFDSAAIREVCRQAEILGFETLWIGDHIVAPTKAGPLHRWNKGFGDRFLDPYIAWMHILDNTKLRVGSNVVVLPYRDPVVQAKMLAALDELSGGRVIFGIGAGYSEPEFQVLRLPYAERGPMTDEWMKVIKLLLTNQDGVVDFHGRYVHLEAVEPLLKTVQKPHPPIHVGGKTKRAIRRTIEYGDGWQPPDMSPDEVRDGIAAMGREMQKAGRTDDMPVTVIKAFRLEREEVAEPYHGRPRWAPERAAQECCAYQEAGLDRLIALLPTVNLDIYLQQMEMLAREVRPQVTSPMTRG